MAKIHYSDFVEGLDAAATLDGTELIAGIQDGVPVKMTTQDVADLGGGGATEITGQLTGLTASDFILYENVGTDRFIFLLQIIATCTDPGGGTVLVGETWFSSLSISGNPNSGFAQAIELASLSSEGTIDMFSPVASFDGDNVIITLQAGDSGASDVDTTFDVTIQITSTFFA